VPFVYFVDAAAAGGVDVVAAGAGADGAADAVVDVVVVDVTGDDVVRDADVSAVATGVTCTADTDDEDPDAPDGAKRYIPSTTTGRSAATRIETRFTV